MATMTLDLTLNDFREALQALKDKRSRLQRALRTLIAEKGKGDPRTREANRRAIDEAVGTVEELEDVIANFEGAINAMQ